VLRRPGNRRQFSNANFSCVVAAVRLTSICRTPQLSSAKGFPDEQGSDKSTNPANGSDPTRIDHPTPKSFESGFGLTWKFPFSFCFTSTVRVQIKLETVRQHIFSTARDVPGRMLCFECTMRSAIDRIGWKTHWNNLARVLRQDWHARDLFSLHSCNVRYMVSSPGHP